LGFNHFVGRIHVHEPHESIVPALGGIIAQLLTLAIRTFVVVILLDAVYQFGILEVGLEAVHQTSLDGRVADVYIYRVVAMHERVGLLRRRGADVAVKGIFHNFEGPIGNFGDNVESVNARRGIVGNSVLAVDEEFQIALWRGSIPTGRTERLR
jgi:hypothetical protein